MFGINIGFHRFHLMKLGRLKVSGAVLRVGIE